MPASPPLNPVAAAYALEASAWLALRGTIPGQPLHDPVAWTAWRQALHAALRAAADGTGAGQASSAGTPAR